MGVIEATVSVPVAREELFERLARLENHWALADRWVEVMSLNGGGDGGVVRLNGPLGLSRTARTTVDRLEPPNLIEGTAAIGDGTRGRVRWTFEPEGNATRVTLRAELVEASSLDRAVWDLGGRGWLESRLRVTLERLRADYQSKD
ncbi:MAG: SRPBCC family protein [Solirubrobacterales bacterium]